MLENLSITQNCINVVPLNPITQNTNNSQILQIVEYQVLISCKLVKIILILFVFFCFFESIQEKRKKNKNLCYVIFFHNAVTLSNFLLLSIIIYTHRRVANPFLDKRSAKGLTTAILYHSKQPTT